MTRPVLDLVVLGDCNPDLVLEGGNIEPVFGQVERLVDDARLVVGGSGAIMACGAARLGLATSLIAVVGDDPLGRFMLDALRERGVIVDGVRVDPERPTGVSVVLLRDGDRAILTATGAIDRLGVDPIDPAAVGSARHVHVSSYFLQRGLHAVLPAVLERARAGGATTSVDPNWDPRGDWDSGLLDTLPLVDVLLCNAEEAVRLAREQDVEAAARSLGERGPLVVIKLGGEGALACRGEHVAQVAADPIEVVDTVGAGDSFDAGFLAATLGGRGLDDALAIAVACGSLSTRAPGGTAAQATRDEAGLG
ncbi:MAG: sugar kinase [Gaiellales bacterium]